MNVWCHLPTIFGQRRVLKFSVLVTLVVAFITMHFFAIAANAAPGINKTISFQGRLLTSGGTPVPDGFYNVQFKIYEGGSGSAAGNPDGELAWTETHVNNNQQGGVKVTNGYMSVALGVSTPFGTSVDWNNDTLWLSMNIAGLTANCTTFNTGSCTADGEMTPMKRLTATPYALNAGMLEGRSASGFIQNGTALQNGNFNISGIGRADLLQGISGIEAPLLDRGDAGTLSIGTTNATAIEIGSATGSQSINIGTGTGDTALAIGSTNGASSLSLRGGTSGVEVSSAGGFTVRTEATDRETLSIGTDGSAAINLSDDTRFNVNNSADESVFSVNNNGTIATGEGSSLEVNGTARLNQGAQVGSGDGTGEPALLTLDRSDSTPLATGDAVLGSMYYDTTLGKVQCYEADGWGACSASPDTFVSLSPEYSNAVVNGTGVGSFTSDVCSDTLNINNGSNADPTVCGADETYNFYNWTSEELAAQTKSIFVNYSLPSNFKKFAANSVSLTARSDGVDSTVAYQIYRNTADGLVACGALVSASDSLETGWRTVQSTGANDPSECDFQPGESVVFKIDLTSRNGVSAYVSNLNFAFSNE